MNTDARFAGSIPAVYEQYLVPLLFEPYAADLAARFVDLKEGVLLELAAGTGAVTRELRRALPSGVRVVATDLNPDMLSIGSGLLSDLGVTWQQANAQQLPFADAWADAMACQFGVMFLPDKLAAYREARRVLRPGGRFVFNVWDRVERNEVTAITAGAIASLFPNDPPRFIERTPFGYFDVTEIRRDVETAGFAHIDIETVERVTSTSTAAQIAFGMCHGTPLRSEIEARDATRLEEAVTTVTAALESRFGTGLVENRMTAHVITARD